MGRAAAATALDVLEDFIEDPPAAARGALDRVPVALGLAGFLAGASSLWIGRALLSGSPASAAPVSVALIFLWEASTGAVLAGLTHLAAEAALPAGRFSPPRAGAALFAMLGLSELAWTPLVPVSLLLRAAGVGGWLPPALLTLALGWSSLALKARSVRDLYGLTTARAWTALAAPYLAAMAVAFAACLLAFTGVAFSLSRWA